MHKSEIKVGQHPHDRDGVNLAYSLKRHIMKIKMIIMIKVIVNNTEPHLWVRIQTTHNVSNSIKGGG